MQRALIAVMIVIGLLAASAVASSLHGLPGPDAGVLSDEINHEKTPEDDEDRCAATASCGNGFSAIGADDRTVLAKRLSGTLFRSASRRVHGFAPEIDPPVPRI